MTRSSPAGSTPTVAPHPTRSLGTVRLLVLGGLSAIGPLSMALYLPALPALALELASSASAVELTVTACMLGIAIGQLIAGPLSDRHGRRLPLLMGLALYAALSALCALAPGVELLLALRFAQGLFGGVGIVIARAVVRDVCDTATAARVFSVLVVITSVAPVLAPLLGGQLLLVTSWRGILGVLALIGVALLLLVVLTLPETLPPEDRRDAPSPLSRRQLHALVSDRSFLRHAIVLTLASGMLYNYVSMSSFVFQHEYDLSAQQYSYVFAAMAVGMVVMATLGSLALRRRSPRFVLLAGIAQALIGCAALLITALTHAQIWVVLAALLIAVSASAVIVPNSTALALSNQQTNAGTAAGVLGVLQFGVGGALAPLLSGAGPTLLLMAAGMLGCAVAGSAATIRRRTRQVAA